MELLTNQQMALVDTLAVAPGMPANGSGATEEISGSATEFELLVNAGRAVASHVIERYRSCARVLVLCGPGNNGGDGYIAARFLADSGFNVRVVSVCPQGKQNVLARRAQKFYGKTVEYSALSSGEGHLHDVDIVVDAMFGAGLNRALQGEPPQWITLLQDQTRSIPVVAIDVPSGLDANTGAAHGAVIMATSTVTFFRLKPGHLLYPGRQWCGEIDLQDIGINPVVLNTVNPLYRINSPSVWHACWPGSAASDHKYDRGHTVVFTGPAHATGAARLSARAALRVGSGLVTLATPADAVPIVAGHVTSAMIAPWVDTDGAVQILSDSRKNSVLIGPGFGVGEHTCQLCLRIFRNQLGREADSAPNVVLDADALSSFGARKDELFECIKNFAAAVVLTPHDGEYARLFNQQGSRLERALHAANCSGAVVVLKGADTVIAAPDGRASINNNAPPALATAGSGDVLAGLVAGLLAQGMDGYAAACAAVWLHGECGNKFGIGLIAEDLPEQLPAVLTELANRLRFSAQPG